MKKRITVLKSTLIKFLCLALMNLTIFNCSNDDSSQNILNNIEGKVMGPVSCNTDGMGLAYGIITDNFEVTSGFIITTTLPEEKKEEGLKIRFDMKPSMKDITICTTNYFPEQFYEIYNISILNN